MSEQDNRAEIEIDLPDDVLFGLMMEAHRRDITFNQLVELILRDQIDREAPDESRD